MTLSKLLRQARIEAELSQGEVARKLGYTSPQFVSNWERETCNAPMKSLPKLAKLYKLNRHVIIKAYIAQVRAELHKVFK